MEYKIQIREITTKETKKIWWFPCDTEQDAIQEMFRDIELLTKRLKDSPWQFDKNIISVRLDIEKKDVPTPIYTHIILVD
jgi:hypothetical protein